MIDQAGRLQRSVADLTLNNRILKEAPGGAFGPFTSSPLCRQRLQRCHRSASKGARRCPNLLS